MNNKSIKYILQIRIKIKQETLNGAKYKQFLAEVEGLFSSAMRFCFNISIRTIMWL